MFRLMWLLTRTALAVTGWDLYATLAEQGQYLTYYRSVPPVACPNDGTLLLAGPPQEPGILYCPFDFWQYPRDYNADIHSGM